MGLPLALVIFGPCHSVAQSYCHEILMNLNSREQKNGLGTKKWSRFANRRFASLVGHMRRGSGVRTSALSFQAGQASVVSLKQKPLGDLCPASRVGLVVTCIWLCPFNCWFVVCVVEMKAGPFPH